MLTNETLNFVCVGFMVHIKPDVHLDEMIPICARDQHLLYNIFGDKWKSPVVINAYTTVKGQTGFMHNWLSNHNGSQWSLRSTSSGNCARPTQPVPLFETFFFYHKRTHTHKINNSWKCCVFHFSNCMNHDKKMSLNIFISQSNHYGYGKLGLRVNYVVFKYDILTKNLFSCASAF